MASTTQTIHNGDWFQTRPNSTSSGRLTSKPNNSAPDVTATRPCNSRSSTTNSHANRAPGVPIPPMDPSPHDATATFFHPPLSEQMSHYRVFAEHTEWFLDEKDWNYEGAPIYPTELEPPRGWCPPKTKNGISFEIDKDKEENRLRCTFCRRTYGGVNAKSMWRRHVFDKHKVAMRNRREMTDKSKLPNENKAPSSTHRRKGGLSRSQLINHAQGFSDGNFKVGVATVYGGVPVYPKIEPPSAPQLLQTPFPHASGDSSDGECQPTPPSPYDPSKTPQFTHTRQKVPLDNALKYPFNDHTFCEPAAPALNVLLRAAATERDDGSYPPPSSSPVLGVASLQFLGDLSQDSSFYSASGAFEDMRSYSGEFLGEDDFADVSGDSSFLSASSSWSSTGEQVEEEVDPEINTLLNQYFDIPDPCNDFLHDLEDLVEGPPVERKPHSKPLTRGAHVGLGFMFEDPRYAVISPKLEKKPKLFSRPLGPEHTTSSPRLVKSPRDREDNDFDFASPTLKRRKTSP
ncbi:hypothetical protein SISNIDRAFT_483309 [Sistotremastrum niveocremeum HHB9708]|uniref:Uncharacterized protein n=1 Tax=Sistotremastrum niveocremeum HHB9708 TaxID=1314777 RepID=A0A164XE94_9AGAM|nr:hypothetical protein SISNIDRAFT_483309 [Sistotremastrum niveocremeum HHB9708]